MVSEKLNQRLSQLADHGFEAHESYHALEPRDDASGLSLERRQGWRRVLSAVSTTEGTEHTLMAPIEEAFASDKELARYLASHKKDEARHHEWLKRYLKNTFQYVKTERTASDKIIYDKVFPQLGKLFRRKPLYGLALLYFVEQFGVTFYKNFKAQAAADGLTELVAMLKLIEKDELRHMAGLDAILKAHVEENGSVSLLDRIAIRGCLEVMAFDVNMGALALHNRDVRNHMQKIQISPLELNRAARLAIAHVMKGLKK